MDYVYISRLGLARDYKGPYSTITGLAIPKIQQLKNKLLHILPSIEKYFHSMLTEIIILKTWYIVQQQCYLDRRFRILSRKKLTVISYSGFKTHGWGHTESKIGASGPQNGPWSNKKVSKKKTHCNFISNCQFMF